MPSYPIPIGKDALQKLEAFLHARSYSQVLVLVDENTHRDCYPLVKSRLPKHEVSVISSGEKHKTLETCQQLWDALTRYAFDRKGLLINLGGGVIGDMGGFVAGTYKRGIDFIQIPTTLLSMVDASIGGKVGIDFEGFKNHIGLFADPQGVFIWPDFLKTLSDRELRSGFAEVIKHHLIADKVGWEGLKTQTDLRNLDLPALIRHSIEIKSRIVDLDPTEQKDRKALNFGHTIGHAIERYYLDTASPVLHGEAVAAGMVCEAFLSEKKGWITSEGLAEITTYLLSIYGKIEIPNEIHDAIWGNMLQDKKNLGGIVRASLIEGPGGFRVDVGLGRGVVVKAIEFYSQ